MTRLRNADSGLRQLKWINITSFVVTTEERQKGWGLAKNGRPRRVKLTGY